MLWIKPGMRYSYLPLLLLLDAWLVGWLVWIKPACAELQFDPCTYSCLPLLLLLDACLVGWLVGVDKTGVR